MDGIKFAFESYIIIKEAVFTVLASFYTKFRTLIGKGPQEKNEDIVWMQLKTLDFQIPLYLPDRQK